MGRSARVTEDGQTGVSALRLAQLPEVTDKAIRRPWADAAENLAIFDHQDRRDALDSIFHREVAVVVDVDHRYHRFAFQIPCCLFHQL